MDVIAIVVLLIQIALLELLSMDVPQLEDLTFAAPLDFAFLNQPLAPPEPVSLFHLDGLVLPAIITVVMDVIVTVESLILIVLLSVPLSMDAPTLFLSFASTEFASIPPLLDLSLAQLHHHQDPLDGHVTLLSTITTTDAIVDVESEILIVIRSIKLFTTVLLTGTLHVSVPSASLLTGLVPRKTLDPMMDVTVTAESKILIVLLTLFFMDALLQMESSNVHLDNVFQLDGPVPLLSIII